MTIQSYEIRALDDFGGRIHWIPSDLGAWCPADSVRRLEADMEALRAELAALKEWRYSDQELAIKILSYLGFSQESSKEPYADRRRDHIAEMICQNCEPLKTELAALKAPPKVLSAEEVTEPGWYKVKFPGDPWTIVRIGDNDGDYSCCQFIGPIKMPEV